MRPPKLDNIFSEITSLKGVGDRIGKFLEKLTGTKIIGLLHHLPTGIIDRTHMPPISTAEHGSIITANIRVDEYKFPEKRLRRRIPYRVFCSNDTGALELVFFNGREDFIRTMLPIGQQRIVSGRVERSGNILQMIHPDYAVAPARLKEICRIEPTYPLTHSITQKRLHGLFAQIWHRIPDIEEWIEPEFLKKQKWQSWQYSVKAAHHPDKPDDISPNCSARQRLAFDELLANQLALALSRERAKKQSGQVIKGDGHLQQQLITNLPFTLTNGQNIVIKEIADDMAAPTRMMRLLQGDVGSGKTIVALISMLNTLECGMQAALMAPTEILSQQHKISIDAMLQNANLTDKIKVEILTGQDKGAIRDEKLARLADGNISIIIGTHALFQRDVVFNRLGLAIIDEQHRFGVKQRLQLFEKGKNVDILLMTATPIPRTLAFTFYGDMDISSLKEKPPGRTPIDTRQTAAKKLDKVLDHLQNAMNKGQKAYWVCPLVEDSEDSDLAAVEDRYTMFCKRFGKDNVGLAHGQMKVAERDIAMQKFKNGDIRLLVATTVIEVGVDVPDATIMIIEHAERFGLAQLHQLRGRVGRGEQASSCLLLYSYPLSDTAKSRLAIMCETEDGFRIAEEDLVLRGSGEVLGTKQSGMPDFKLADLSFHKELLLAARDDVKLIMHNDPELQTPRGAALKTLLYLFEYDAHIKYSNVG